MKKRLLLIFCVSIVSHSLFAQGDGPRNLLWGPKGVTAFIPKWMNLEQNLTTNNILISGADIKINVFPMTLIHNFDIKGRFAQVMLNAVPGNVDATALVDTFGVSSPSYSNSGFADGFVGFKLGLINAPALNVKEFAKHQQKFSMFLYTRLWYSGTYSVSDPINMGSNRIAIDVGFPMNIQFSKNPKRATWLEMYPAIHWYADNNNPTTISRASTLKQLPLFSFENHFSHNFTDKLWAGITLRYQYGGAVALDNLIDPGTTINMLGTGVTVGYQVLPMLALHTGYGRVIAGANDISANMFRVVAVISYVNMKKLKEATN